MSRHYQESRIPDEELFFELIRVSEVVDRPPSTVDMQEHSVYSPATYTNRLGTWPEVLSAAGFEFPEDRFKPVPKDDLVEELQRLGEELGRPPKSDEMEELGEFGRGVYHHRFGSWNHALEAAGFPPRAWKEKYSTQELADELRRVGRELGYSPTVREFERNSEISPTTVQERFGSWSNALKALGLAD